MSSLDLYLASTSPRRCELLTIAGLRFQLCAPGAEYLAGAGHEHASELGDPRVLAQERARRKGLGATVLSPDIPILAVDTVVDLDGLELGKPRDREQAAAMLQQLAGRRHLVHTAHFVWLPASGHRVTQLASAEVACAEPDPAALQHYLDSQQWRGKAGSYGVQDDEQAFFRVVSGSFDTVVGLHIAAVRELLQTVRASS